MTDFHALVLGATGTIGRRVTALLTDAGRPVRAASRHGQPPFDWADRQTWPVVTAGVSSMFLMAPDGVPVEPDFVSGAVDSGVRRIVLLSSRGIEVMGDQRLLDAERTVRDCGVEWTIVRPDWFNQNFDEGVFHEAVLVGELALPVGEVRQAFVDAGDIAAVAAAALTEDGHAGRSYDVTGPAALSFADAMATIGAAAGRELVFRGDVEDFLAAQEAVGTDRATATAIAEAFGALRAEGDATPTDVVYRVTGRQPTTFERYAAAAAARGAWAA